MSNTVLISGGAGYIGSHTSLVLKNAGYSPVVIDNLVNGNRWAADHANAFRQGDIGDAAFVRSVCNEFRPVAALHFAAFIEVGESVAEPAMYFENNRDKAKVFFSTLADCGVGNVVFSSTAAVYGDPKDIPITEEAATDPVNPYGRSKLEAEQFLRSHSAIRSVALRYFNVAGAAGTELGEAHFPESHLIPRLILPLIDLPAEVIAAMGLGNGFKVFGTDYPTRDGTAVRDYLHVLDLAEAHVLALRYLLEGGPSNVFNLGSGNGFSVEEIVSATRRVLNRPDFNPSIGPRRAGDPPLLIADSRKARQVLDWSPKRDIAAMIASAAAWQRTELYRSTIVSRARAQQPSGPCWP